MAAEACKKIGLTIAKFFAILTSDGDNWSKPRQISIKQKERKFMKISKDTQVKLAWIGKMLFIGIIVALFASIAIEATIYTLADKVAAAYTSLK